MIDTQRVIPMIVNKGGKSKIFAILAAGTGLMVGLDIGVIAGALDLITDHFKATVIAQEWIVSGMMVGAAIGALFAGQASMKLGRKKTLVASAVLYVVGCLLCSAAWSIASLIAARTLLGLSIGVAAFTGPLYISEIAEPKQRGGLIAFQEIFLTGGVLLAFLSDTLLHPFGAWRLMLGIVCVPGIVFCAFAWVLPETPRWLALQGRPSKALQTLILLRGDALSAKQELVEISEGVCPRASGFALFRLNSQFRKVVYLGVVLQLVQQLTGINVVMYYAPRVFGIIGFDQTGRLLCMTAAGLINVLSASLATWLVERAGRRPLLLFGFTGMCLTLVGLGVLLAHGIASQAAKLAALASVLGFVMCFALSAGPVVWVLCSEIQPLQGRDFGVAASTFTNWAANTVVGASFLSLLVWMGASGTLVFYGVLNAVFILFTLKYVPETKGVSLEHIERRLYAGFPLRRLGEGDEVERHPILVDSVPVIASKL